MAKNILFTGKKISLVTDTFINDNGRVVTFEGVLFPGAVTIVPCMDENALILLKQYRRIIDQNIYELPAGTLEDDEAPLQCAKRELEEETGYRGKDFNQLCTFYTSPGILDEKMWVFEARGLSKTKQNLDEDESISVEIVPFDKVLEMIRAGKIIDAKTIASILFYITFK